MVRSCVDLQGRTMMTGFVDGHTHLLIFYYRMDNTPKEAREIPLAHGHTMVSEMGAKGDVVLSLAVIETKQP
jgi:predicted amidohydrolase YtcJ